MAGTNYFSYFPTIDYYCPGGCKKVTTDIFKRVKFREINRTINSSVFYKYTIQDGERPEDIAERYYGDTQYYWIILYANNIINPYAQWPRSYREFEKYIVSKYGSVESVSDTTDESAVHHYEDDEGNWITKANWDGTLSKRISIYDYEYNLNEDKKEINIVKVEYLRQIINEMNELFNE
jgi:hypothetical protein